MSGTEFISVENITPFAVWVFDGKKEYAIPFSEFPCLAEASVEELMHPTLTHGFHLRWEHLDVDIDLRSLSHLNDFPVYFESKKPALHAVAEEDGVYAVKMADRTKCAAPAATKHPAETRKIKK